MLLPSAAWANLVGVARSVEAGTKALATCLPDQKVKSESRHRFGCQVKVVVESKEGNQEAGKEQRGKKEKIRFSVVELLGCAQWRAMIRQFESNESSQPNVRKQCDHGVGRTRFWRL